MKPLSSEWYEMQQSDEYLENQCALQRQAEAVSEWADRESQRLWFMQASQGWTDKQAEDWVKANMQ